MAFTITTNIGGTAATLVGTNSSDSVAAAQLVNISSISLTAFDADDVAVLGGTALSSAQISMGQGDDQVTTGAAVSGSSSLIDLGEGSDVFNSAFNLSSLSIKGFGGLDTFNFTGAGTLTNVFVNGNVAADRINIGTAAAAATGNITGATIVGGSEDDIITINTTGRISGGRINGQNGDDTITVNGMAVNTTTTMFGGQGNDVLTAAFGTGTTAHVIFSGDLGNDTLTGIQQLQNVSGDLLFGGGGNDIITSNGGADTMSGGDGVDTFNLLTDTYMSVAFTDVAANGTIETGDSFTLGTFIAAGVSPKITNITDFVGGGAGDILNTTNGTNALSALGLTAANFGLAGQTYKLAGAYNAANGVFTVTADNLGTDTLIKLNGNGAGANEFILLQGTSASTLTAANFV